MEWAIPTVFEIISIGDADMLGQAFNGLAAITNNGSFVNMTRVAFLVGLLAFGARAVMTGRFELTTLLASVVMYAVMFGPRATVIVVDHYTGASRAIANVPVGVAGPFSLVSMTGRFFAETFETAFSVIGPDNQYLKAGYLDALAVLLRMRNIDAGTANAPDNAKAADMMRSVKNYIVGCVYYDLELKETGSPEVTRERIRQSPDLWGALRTTFVNISVMLYLPSGGDRGTPYSCKRAYEELSVYFTPGSAWMTGVFDPWVKAMLDKNLAMDMNATDRIQGALNSINLGALDAQRFALNSFLVTVLRTTDQSFYTSRGDVASAIISSQAENQRNVQWTAERTMFEKVARPVTAFIEVFLVAATPLMAFAIAAFGSAGVQTLGKYLLLHFWVTLWGPTLAIANMYTFTKVNKYIDYIQSATASGRPIEPGSLLGMDTIMQQLQTDFATGSMLAASTPMLTLLLIYGSSQVASVLAGKMSSAEQVDAKVASPPVLQPGPVVRADSMYSGNPMLGFSQTGGQVPTVSVGQTGIQSLSSMSTAVQRTGDSVSRDVSRAYRDSEGKEFGVQYQQGHGWQVQGGGFNGLTASLNLSTAAARGATKDVNRQASLARAYTDALGAGGHIGASLAGLTLGGGGKGPKAPIDFGIEANKRVAMNLASTAGVNVAEAEKFLQEARVAAQRSDSVGAEFRDSIQSNGQFQKGRGFKTAGSREDSARVGKSLSESLEAQEAFSNTQMMNTVYGAHESLTPLQMLDRYKQVQQMKGNKDWRAQLMGLYSQTFNGDEGKQAAALERARVATSAAIAATPARSNSESELDRLAAAQLFVMASPGSGGAPLIGRGLTLTAGDTELAYNRNSVVGDNAAKTLAPAGELRNQSAAAIAGAEETTSKVPSQLNKARAVAARDEQAASRVINRSDVQGHFNNAENAANDATSAVNNQAQSNVGAFEKAGTEATGLPVRATQGSFVVNPPRPHWAPASSGGLGAGLGPVAPSSAIGPVELRVFTPAENPNANASFGTKAAVDAWNWNPGVAPGQNSLGVLWDMARKKAQEFAGK